ncbi:hypothetical protein [Streptomyces sp. NPDC090025]|uniref:hypothetical protein n=1 Tax=Streptomyces sp. NPDC090025 TaxID=3365922 RepID=UPI0038399356
MSDAPRHPGPVVNMNGGQGNIGINYGTNVVGSVPADDTALRTAVAELTALLQELRGDLAPDQTRVVDDALPALAPDRTPDRAALRERGLMLASLAQIAAAAGAVGQPVADALGRLLALLGQG